MKNIPKNKILILIILSIIFILALVVILALRTNTIKETSSDNYLIEDPTLPKDNWSRSIEIETATNNTNLVVNNFDGYSISLPKEWLVENEATKAGGLKAFFDKNITDIEQSNRLHADSGLVLNIKVKDNPNKLSIIDWIAEAVNSNEIFSKPPFSKEKIGEYEMYRAGSPLLDETFENNNLIKVPIEDTQRIDFITGNKEKMFIISCVALDNISENIPPCLEVINTFHIL